MGIPLMKAKFLKLLMVVIAALALFPIIFANDYDESPSRIQTETKSLGDLDQIFAHAEGNQQKQRPFQKYTDEKIIYIVPDDFNKYDELKSLNDTIKSTYPKIRQKNFIINKSSQIGCNSYGELEENTLILIGNRSNNNAIKCTPWYDTGKKPGDKFDAAVTLERNVWGGDTYAFVLSGNETLAIRYLNYTIANPDSETENAQTTYIYQFSIPPEYISGTDRINAYAFNECEYLGEDFFQDQFGCHIIGFGAYFVPYVGLVAIGRDVGNYCLIAEHDGNDWFMCATTAIPIAHQTGTLGNAFKWVKIPTPEFAAYTKLQTTIRSILKKSDADKTLNNLDLNNNEKLKKFFKLNSEGKELEQQLSNKLDELERTLRTNKNGATQISQLDKTTIQNTIKYTDDFNNLIKGTDLASSYTPDIKKIPLPEQELANTLKKLGTITEVPGVKSTGSGANKIQGLAEMFAKQNDASSIKGPVFHIDVTSSLSQNKNIKSLAVEKEITGELGAIQHMLIGDNHRPGRQRADRFDHGLAVPYAPVHDQPLIGRRSDSGRGP